MTEIFYDLCDLRVSRLWYLHIGDSYSFAFHRNFFNVFLSVTHLCIYHPVQNHCIQLHCFEQQRKPCTDLVMVSVCSVLTWLVVQYHWKTQSSVCEYFGVIVWVSFNLFRSWPRQCIMGFQETLAHFPGPFDMFRDSQPQLKPVTVYRYACFVFFGGYFCWSTTYRVAWNACDKLLRRSLVPSNPIV